MQAPCKSGPLERALRSLEELSPGLFILALLPRKASSRLRALHLAVAVLLLRRPALRFLQLFSGKGRLAATRAGWIPLLGDMLFMNNLAKTGIWDGCVRLHEALGSTFKLTIGPAWMPFRNFQLTVDARNVEHVLKTNFENYGKGPELECIFEEFLGKGIFVVDGPRWLVQRKTAAAIFTRKNFGEHMTSVFQEHARHLIKMLQGSKEEVELQRCFFSLTLDAFCEVGFGVPWRSMEGDEDAELRVWARHFDRVQEIIVNRFSYRPLWRLERLLRRLIPSHEENDLAKGMRFIDDVVERLIEERRGKEKGRADLLSLFMQSEEELNLRDIVMNFVLAGRDTSACTLTWLFYELARHPEELERLRAEVAAESREGDDFSYAQLNRMKRCLACVRETVRLHPPVPADPKLAYGDDVLPDGTMISKGDFIFYEPYAMARDKKSWGPDAGTWRPERWLGSEKEPSAFVNCAFQAGPRVCLGRDMALLEVRAVLAQVLASGMAWELREGFEAKYKYPAIVLPMAAPGLPVTLSFPEA